MDLEDYKKVGLHSSVFNNPPLTVAPLTRSWVKRGMWCLSNIERGKQPRVYSFIFTTKYTLYNRGTKYKIHKGKQSKRSTEQRVKETVLEKVRSRLFNSIV